MSRAIRISEKHAKEILSLLSSGLGPGTHLGPVGKAAYESIHDQVTRGRLKSSAVKKTEKKRRQTSRDMKEIRAAVMERARGFCECGCNARFSPANPAELDHFFGRGKAAQTVQNCWALTNVCHRAKTNNYPDAARWQVLFIDHAVRYGFTAEADQARRRRDALLMTGRAS